MNFKFTEYIEIPVTISYIYEPPDPSVGYKGGIVVEETDPDLADKYFTAAGVDIEEICRAHYEGECERLECEKAEYYDDMAKTQLILRKWHEEEAYNARPKNTWGEK